MQFTVDIDTGGTFTDGYVQGKGRFEVVKVDTTPHDLTVCFMNCIEEASKRFDYDSVESFLADTDMVRLSTTIATNTIIQGKGSRLGLIVTKPNAKDLYSDSNDATVAVGTLVSEDMICEVNEKLDELGNSIEGPQPKEVLQAIKYLLEHGAGRIVVSLKRSPLNPAHEEAIKEIVLDNYPVHYLGTVPLTNSTEVSAELNDYMRTNEALTDAYVHRQMVRYMYKAEEDIRNRHFPKQLLIVHSSGGQAKVAKTKGIDTVTSGPTAGMFGASHMAKLYQLDNVMTYDMGGTSTDVGFVINGEPCYSSEVTVGDVPIRRNFVETMCAGVGAGSIIKVNESKKVQVGPQSAGAMPGPACYGLGGSDATITDAWVVLGYLDPKYFLGGKKKLDVEAARDAIKEHVADPLGIGVEEAAFAAITEAYTGMARILAELISVKGLKPQDLALFSIGGAGGLLTGQVANALGIPRVYGFPYSSTFCAFGSSCMDMGEDFSIAPNMKVRANHETMQKFNETVQELADKAYHEMEGNGSKRGEISLNLTILASSEPSQIPTEVPWPSVTLSDINDIEKILNLYSTQNKITNPLKEVFVQQLRLRASSPLARPELPRHQSASEDPRAALKGTRIAFWEGQFMEIPIYERKQLRPLNVIKGLAIVESEVTSVLVPPGKQYRVDEYLNSIIE